MNLFKLSMAMLFLITFNNLNAQELTMFPGGFGFEYYQDDVKIPRSKVNALMMSDQQASISWKKYKTQNIVSVVSSIASLGFGLAALNNAANNRNTDVLLSAFVGTSIAGSIFGLSANKHRRDAFLQYNEILDTASINLDPTNNGLGLVLRF